MAFCCQMNNGSKFVFVKKCVDERLIIDVAFYEQIIRSLLNISEIFKIPCVSEQIEIYKAICRIVIYKPADNMRTYKTCATGDQYGPVIIVHYKLQYALLLILLL